MTSKLIMKLGTSEYCIFVILSFYDDGDDDDDDDKEEDYCVVVVVVIVWKLNFGTIKSFIRSE